MDGTSSPTGNIKLNFETAGQFQVGANWEDNNEDILNGKKYGKSLDPFTNLSLLLLKLHSPLLIVDTRGRQCDALQMLFAYSSN